MARLGQAVNQVVDQEVRVGFAYTHHAPWKLHLGRTQGDEVATFFHQELKVVVAPLFFLDGVTGKIGGERRAVFLAMEQHVGVMSDVGFGDANLEMAGGLYQHGQKGELRLVGAGHFGVGIGIFKGIDELFFERSAFLTHVREIGGGTVGKTEVGLFVHHLQLFVRERDEAVGRSLVEGPQLQTEPFAKGQRQFVVVVLYFFFSIEECLHRFALTFALLTQ